MREEVIFSSGIPVKLALASVDSRTISCCSTETGRCTSLLFAVLLLSMATMMKVFAST